MARFEFDKRAIKKIGDDMTAAIREILNEVAETHGGRPEPEVRSALLAAARRKGVKYEPGDDAVKAISSNPETRFT
jgi:hypothetical protein